MKKTLSLFALFGSLALAVAQQTYTTPSTLYNLTWSSSGIAASGWTFILAPGAASGGPYDGVFSGPPEEVYFEDFAAGASALLYTTDSTTHTTFTDLNPANYPNLSFNLTYENAGANIAIQQGGAWYVSTTVLTKASPSLVYTSAASAWDTLTLGAAGAGVTIGAQASANLSGTITGVGLVVTGTAGNYGPFSITSVLPQPPPNVTLFSEDWGAASGATSPGYPAVGWSSVGIAYTGTYVGSTANFDVVSGVALSNIDMYMSPDNATPFGMAYTCDTNVSGFRSDFTQGGTNFTDINPANYPSLSFNTYVQASSSGYGTATQIVTNYWAVEVAGQWYVYNSPMGVPSRTGGTSWALNTLLYTNNYAASAWSLLNLGASSLAISGPAPAPLTGPIQGIGIVQAFNTSATTSAGTGYGYNYVNLTITAPSNNPGSSVAPVLNAPGFSQTTYATGTASFAVDAYNGTAPLNFTWTFTATNASGTGTPVTIVNGANGSGTGAFIFGATTNQLTISNVSLADAGYYSVEVENLYGEDFSTNYVTNSLNVNVLSNNILYAQTFPFVGPFSANENLTNVGWKSTIGPSLAEGGFAYAYEIAPTTLAFYTSTNTALATLPGIPFPHSGINPANYPFVSFRANIAADATATGDAVYWAVQTAGGAWYVSSSAINIAGAAFPTYGLQFSTAVASWNTLTLTANSAVIGAAATSPLAGNITGAGLVFVIATNSLYAVDSFSVVTNSTPPVPPTITSLPFEPYPQTVYQGGGTGFSLTEAGSVPFTNTWEFDDSQQVFQSGATLVNGTNADGSIILGATSTAILIQNVQPAEGGTYSGWVVNGGGTNSTDAGLYGSPILTVATPPVGLIYYENYALYGPATGNVSGTNFGWTSQSAPYPAPGFVYYQQNAVAGIPTANAAGFAYMGSTTAPTNSLFYASTKTDTGYNGLPFVAFDPASYPANTIEFSTSIGQSGATYTNVQGSFAIQQGNQWYVMSTPFWPFYTNAAPSAGLNTALNTVETETYTPAASAWNLVTFVGANGVVIGGNPTANLSGPITAAGLLFQGCTAGTGTMNWISFEIQAVGAGNLIGSVNVGPVTNGTVTLSWVGNPAVNLQSASSVTSAFTDVPNTLGQHSFTVTAAGVQKFYRLVMH